MPSRNSIKQYLDGGYYHIYNRGVEKRKIFQDEQDYAVFLSYLKNYLTPKDTQQLTTKLADPNINYKEKAETIRLLRMNNFHEEISLLSYCLMLNHFHLLIKQIEAISIDKFMNSLLTRYVMYFNRKYKRIGPLFQDVYKAVLVESDSQLVYLSAYIHRNPLGYLSSKGVPFRVWLTEKQPSSYSEYLELRKTSWINHKEILSFFSRTNKSLSYDAFVEQTEDFTLIDKLLIDED